MKHAIWLFPLVATAFAAGDLPALADIPGFVYVHDAKKFVGEDSKQLSADGRRALLVAKAVVAFRLKSDVEGKFSVAEVSWGYQVDFSALKIKKDGVWVEATEGFGEVFLSKKMDRIQVDYGP